MIFIKELTVDQHRYFLTIFIKNLIKSYEQNLIIAEKLNIENPVMQGAFLLSRKISLLESFNRGGNTIYIKDLNDVPHRLLTSLTFCIHTTNGLKL